MKLADGPVTLETNGIGSGTERTTGYHRWRDYAPEGEHHYEHGYEVVYVHQLVAIADGADPYDVFASGDYEVHHEEQDWTGGRPLIEWNVPGALTVQTHVDHWNRHIHGTQPQPQPERPINDTERANSD